MITGDIFCRDRWILEIGGVEMGIDRFEKFCGDRRILLGKKIEIWGQVEWISVDTGGLF